ncbi:MAG TPA: hypothetical protein VNB24_08335 [Acidimicrobiales bacterium]|nr:hypothetical protein [Acidimicrobiales bacterium]
MEFVPYEDFGALLVETAVTADRVVSAVAALSGDEIAVGPMSVGPGGAASVVATGSLGRPEASIVGEGPRRFDVAVPARIVLDVTVAGGVTRYEANLVAHLFLTVQTAAPLALVIDIDPPRKRDIELEVRSSGWRAKVIGRLGDVDRKIREQVVVVISQRLETPAARSARVIDLSSKIDAVWEPPA